MSDSWSIVAFRVALTLWLVTVSVWDHLHRRVPNWLVLPVMAGALGFRIYGAFVGQADFDVAGLVLGAEVGQPFALDLVGLPDLRPGRSADSQFRKDVDRFDLRSQEEPEFRV